MKTIISVLNWFNVNHMSWIAIILLNSYSFFFLISSRHFCYYVQIKILGIFWLILKYGYLLQKHVYRQINYIYIQQEIN